MAAEGNELPVRPITVHSRELLQQVLDNYAELAVPRRCQLQLHADAPDPTLHADITILSRVLGNMVKNAIEASSAGEVITASCRLADSTVTFSVHNPATIPQEVQLQLFKRSFSTKGAGRGLGTYSMLLLTEKYLKGRVWFTSADGEGTTFFVSVPADTTA